MLANDALLGYGQLQLLHGLPCLIPFGHGPVDFRTQSGHFFAQAAVGIDMPQHHLLGLGKHALEGADPFLGGNGLSQLLAKFGQLGLELTVVDRLAAGRFSNQRSILIQRMLQAFQPAFLASRS